MADRLTVVSGNEKQKKWPKEGDVFYFQLRKVRISRSFLPKLTR